MMMECPRCGFSQPKDRFCANCGLDVDNFTAKPKPVLVRLLQNPNFHLGLIAVLVALLIAYIVHSSSHFMSHEVSSRDGQPLTSRDAAVPESRPASPRATMVRKVEKAPTPPPAKAEATAVVTAQSTNQKETKAAAPKVKRLQLSSWEVPRNVLVTLIEPATKLNETNEGRVYMLSDAQKVIDTLEHSARRVALDRHSQLTDGARIVVETPPTASEAFQFGLMVQLSQFTADTPTGPTATLKLDSTLVSTQPTAGSESSNLPTMRPLIQSNITGTASLTPGNLLLMVIVPSNRTPAASDLAKAGAGPWSIFTSQAFRAAVTDWVMVLRLD